MNDGILSNLCLLETSFEIFATSCIHIRSLANNSREINIPLWTLRQEREGAWKDMECSWMLQPMLSYPIVLRNPHASAIEQRRCNARRTWYWQLVLDIKLCAICIASSLCKCIGSHSCRIGVCIFGLDVRCINRNFSNWMSMDLTLSM